MMILILTPRPSIQCVQRTIVLNIRLEINLDKSMFYINTILSMLSIEYWLVTIVVIHIFTGCPTNVWTPLWSFHRLSLRNVKLHKVKSARTSGIFETHIYWQLLASLCFYRFLCFLLLAVCFNLLSVFVWFLVFCIVLYLFHCFVLFEVFCIDTIDISVLYCLWFFCTACSVLYCLQCFVLDVG